jgi:hypothetical protein
MAYIQKLVFNKTDNKLWCWDTDGNCYAYFNICFNYWGPHTAIANGTYPITHEDEYAMDYGHYIGDAYGQFWIALDRKTGKGFHGFGVGRTMTSGTYGCVRGDNDDGVEICKAIDVALDNKIKVIAEVIGDVDEDTKFCLGGRGEQ